MSEDTKYRPCAGVVLANAEGRIFTGERIDAPGAWQMPQGGIDGGESAEMAAFRELEEETGVPRHMADLEAEHPDWIYYDLPDHLVRKLWKGRYKGQKQRWFLFRFKGKDADIQIDQPYPEFAQWRWSTPDEVIDHIVPFKRDVYTKVIAAFRAQL